MSVTRFKNIVRDLVPRLFIVAVLALLGGAAWLTRHPDDPWLRRAEDWPIAGSTVLWFREQYRPPATPAQDRAGGSASAEVIVDDAVTPWTPPALPPPGQREIVWLLPGTKLYRAPTTTAPVVRDVLSVVNAIKLERRGDWFRLHYAGSEGWAFLDGYDESGGPPYGEAPEPPRALPPRQVDEDTLAMARDLLGDGERVVSAGPYALYTDSTDDDLIRYLDGLAGQVEALYAARYGCRPLGSPTAALILYRSELTYRILERRSERIAGLHSAGHVSGGLAVLFVADDRRAEVGATLVHELVHFLNRRAIGPALPPWIDEGLADDLALSRVSPDGRIDPTGLRGKRRREGDKVRVDGGLASLQNLRDAMRDGRLPPLRILLDLDWERFVRSDHSRVYYGASAFWVRYLLAADGGRHAGALRRFLAGIAAGEPASPEVLRELLGMEWAELDAAFRAWLAAHPPRHVLAPA